MHANSSGLVHELQEGAHHVDSLGPPFCGEGSPTKIDYRQSWYPDSILSTGGPSSFTAGLSTAHPAAGAADTMESRDQESPVTARG